MLTTDLGQVMTLKTPTKPSVEAKDWETAESFYSKAQACLRKFLECKDIEVIHQARNEFREFCAKILRASAKLGQLAPGEETFAQLELVYGLESLVQRQIVECQRRLHICGEYHELHDSVLMSVRRELDDMQNQLFLMTERKIDFCVDDFSTRDIYLNLLDRVDPLKATVQFLSMRVECYKLSAELFYPQSVSFLTRLCRDISEQVVKFVRDFNNVKVLSFQQSNPSAPGIQIHKTKVSAAPNTRSASAPGPKIQTPSQPLDRPDRPASSIPVLNLRLRGQRNMQPSFQHEPIKLLKEEEPIQPTQKPAGSPSAEPQLKALPEATKTAHMKHPPPRFVSKLQKPTEVPRKARPVSDSELRPPSALRPLSSLRPPSALRPRSGLRPPNALQPPSWSSIDSNTANQPKSRPTSCEVRLDRFLDTSRAPSGGIPRHTRSSSLISTSSSLSNESLASPPHSGTDSNPRILADAPVLLPDALNPRPQSRLMRPTPIDLNRIRNSHHHKEKENEEMSGIPISVKRRSHLPPLSTISEVPKYQGSPVRKGRPVSQLYQTPLR